MNPTELKARTKQFAHRCVHVAVVLPETDLGRILRRQLIRCATSVAANYRAVCVAQSRASFKTKMSTALEEADESWFWLEFIADEGLLARNALEALLQEAAELTNIFAAARRTVEDQE